METLKGKGRSGGENGPAKAKALGLIGGALAFGALAAGAQAGFSSGFWPWRGVITDEIITTRLLERKGNEREELIADVRKARAWQRRTRNAIAGAESAMVQALSRVEFLRETERRRQELREVYLSGHIDPKNASLDAAAGRAAIIQRRFLGSIGYQPSTLSTLYDYPRGLRQGPEGAMGRTISSIIESGKAGAGERTRVLASLVLAAGGEAYLSADGLWLYALVKKNANADDIREIGLEYLSFARAHGRDGKIQGRLFGKDYFLFCDPAHEPAPGLGTLPAEGDKSPMYLEKLDY